MKYILQNWKNLNLALCDADEDLCNALLEAEQKGAARKTYLLRIYARLNRMRAGTERLRLKSGAHK